MSDDRQLFTVTALEGRTLKLAGELDTVSVPELNKAFTLQNGRADVVLDLSQLTFIDSSGIHAIVSFARSREAIGTVTLHGSSPFLLRLFEITQITQLPNLRLDA
jgi:anti-sigma B factor antagonist